MMFLLPIGLILVLLAQVQNKDIDFATSEVAGTRALAALGTLQAATDTALHGGTGLAGVDERLEQAGFPDLGLSQDAAALTAAFRSAGDAAALTSARTSLRDLQSKVGDRSNLILDNVLATYYLTDVVLTRMPDLLDRLTDIGPLAAAQGTSVEARADFLIALGGLTAVLSGLDSSMHSAVDDDPTGAAGTALSKTYETLQKDLAALSAGLQAAADTPVSAALLTQCVAFMQQTNVELSRQLVARVDHMKTVQRLAFAATLLLFGLAAAGTMLVIRNGVVRPVNALCLVTRRLADGDLDAAPVQRESGDEVSDLARDIGEFRRRLLDKRDLEADREHADALRDQRYLAMGTIASDFNTAISGQLGGLSSALEQLRGTAEAAAARAEGTSREAAEISERTTVADQNTQAVAAATEQLAASSREIAAAVDRSTDASRQMQVQAEQATGVMTDLTDVAQGMAGVIELISSIAAQTNLLALNATIEAARAGEAGKGFAVVASEVKSLAMQTARATEEIGKQIGAIQVSAERAADLTRLIASQVVLVETSAGAIAGAVSEQGGATMEISRNVQQAAACIRDVADRMDGLGRDAGATKDSSAEMLAAFRRMADQAGDLHRQVDGFLVSISQAADRRTYERYAANGAVEIVTAAGKVLRGQISDLGEGGFAMHCETALTAGDAVTVAGLTEGRLNARVVASANGLMRLQFRYDRETQAAVVDMLKRRAGTGLARAA